VKDGEERRRPEQGGWRAQRVKDVKGRDREENERNPWADQHTLRSVPVDQPTGTEVAERPDDAQHNSRAERRLNRHLESVLRIGREIFERVIADRACAEDQHAGPGNDQQWLQAARRRRFEGLRRQRFFQRPPQNESERHDRRADQESHAPAPGVELGRTQP